MAQSALPGLEFAFGVGGEEINSSFAGFDAQQQFTVAARQ